MTYNILFLVITANTPFFGRKLHSGFTLGISSHITNVTGMVALFCAPFAMRHVGRVPMSPGRFAVFRRTIGIFVNVYGVFPFFESGKISHHFYLVIHLLKSNCTLYLATAFGLHLYGE